MVAWQFQMEVLMWLAIGVVLIFCAIFIGGERWEKFFKTLELMFCVCNESRLRLYAGVSLALLVGIVLFIQWSDLNRPA